MPWNDWISQWFHCFYIALNFDQARKNSLPQIFLEINNLPKGSFANKRLSKKRFFANNVSPNSHLHPRNLPSIKPNRLLTIHSGTLRLKYNLFWSLSNHIPRPQSYDSLYLCWNFMESRLDLGTHGLCGNVAAFYIWLLV